MADFTELLEIVAQMSEDEEIPKRVRESVKEIKNILEAQDEEEDIKINNCLELIEDFGSGSEINSYTRAKIWSLVSKLEEFNQ
ncbi:MAG: UPF0147 family protein [Clostridiales bacterium]|nr:UPF0147 family protein [Clostridiales bacterium]